MNYLSILAAVLTALGNVATALTTAEQDVLPTLQTVWTDLQAAYASIVSAFTGGTTLTDSQLATINATLSQAQTLASTTSKDEAEKKD